MTPRQTELAALPELLSVSEASAALRCNARTINRLVKRGDLLKNGKSKRHSKILKSSLLVCIVTHGDSVPACDYASPSDHKVNDSGIFKQYEDAPESDEAQPEPESRTDDAAFKKQCAYYDSLLPSIGQLEHMPKAVEHKFQETVPYVSS